MKTRIYNNFIKGYIYAINEIASGNIHKLKNMYLYAETNSEFEDGVFKGIIDSDKLKFGQFSID